MRMTPLDVQSHQFGRRLRGYDPDEVDAFLRVVSEDYEELLRESQSRGDRIRRLERRVEELSAQEDLLKETLISAQTMIEDVRRVAERDAEIRLAEVEIRAEKILDASHRRAARLAQDIRDMRALRVRLGQALRSAAETHLSILATLEADPEPEPLIDARNEGAIAYLSRSAGDHGGFSAKRGEPGANDRPGFLESERCFGEIHIGLGKALGHRGPGRPRRQDTNIDTVLLEFVAERFAERQQVGFRGGVICQIRSWAVGDRRGDEEYAAVPPLGQTSTEMPGDFERRDHIDLSQAPLGFGFVFYEVAVMDRAGIVDHQTDFEIGRCLVQDP